MVGERSATSLVTSPAVLDELAGGRPERSATRLALLRELPVLSVEPPIVEIVQANVELNR